MVISNSNDLTLFDFQVYWDISGTSPVINLTNLSEGVTSPALANVTYWFIATSPSNTVIHEGSESTPDEEGAWEELLITDAWPMPYKQIESSGAPYKIVGYAKDNAGNIYTVTKYAVICMPQGNTSMSKDTYGLGNISVLVQCDQANVFLQDQTNTSYKGNAGTRVSATIKVIYPIDETDNIPVPFSADDFSSALIPITYSSNNYQFVYNSIYDYDQGDNVIIRIRYKLKRTFAVLCNIDLCPLVCEIAKLVDSIENGTCTDANDANNKLILINSKLALVFIGIKEPLCGVDVPELIEEIKSIGGFDCNCCNVATGIIPQTNSIIDNYNFSVVTSAGDVGGAFSNNGNNIVLTLYDKTYVFKMDAGAPTTAFTVSPSLNSTTSTKTYTLNVNLTTLSTDILNNIKNNGTLVNLFNSIVAASGSLDLVVDGDCIFESLPECDYIFTLYNIPATSSFAQLVNVKKGSTIVPLTYSFNQSNLAGLVNYLNNLGYGTFSASNTLSGVVQIISNTNNNDLSDLIYKVASTNYVADISKECAGFTPVSAEYVVQQIINYIGAIDTSQVKLVDGNTYEICYIDSDGDKQTQTITADATTLETFIQALLSKGCTTIDYIIALNAGVSCDSIKSVFAESATALTGTDFILGTKGGGCARVTYTELFQFMLLNMTAATKLIFCAAVTACGAGLSCTPYNYFYATVVAHSTTCTAIVGIEGEIS